MIAKLTGILDSSDGGEVVIDVGGIGYLVFCSARTMAALPAIGDRLSLAIETHIREDHIHLYGFDDSVSRDWFRLLQSVQGVGAKVALGLLSVLQPDEMALAVAAQDAAAFARASGVGPKLAKRITMELKDRVPVFGGGEFLVAGGAGGAGTAASANNATAMADAVSALTNLGYRPADAQGAVGKAIANSATGDKQDDQDNYDTEALIRGALLVLAR